MNCYIVYVTTTSKAETMASILVQWSDSNETLAF